MLYPSLVNLNVRSEGNQAYRQRSSKAGNCVVAGLESKQASWTTESSEQVRHTLQLKKSAFGVEPRFVQSKRDYKMLHEALELLVDVMGSSCR